MAGHETHIFCSHYKGNRWPSIVCGWAADNKSEAPGPLALVTSCARHGLDGCCVLYFTPDPLLCACVDGNHLIYTRSLNEFSIVLAQLTKYTDESRARGVQGEVRKNHGDKRTIDRPSNLLLLSGEPDLTHPLTVFIPPCNMWKRTRTRLSTGISWMSNNIMHTQSVLNTSSPAHILNTQPNSLFGFPEAPSTDTIRLSVVFFAPTVSPWIKMFLVMGGEKINFANVQRVQNVLIKTELGKNLHEMTSFMSFSSSGIGKPAAKLYQPTPGWWHSFIAIKYLPTRR